MCACVGTHKYNAQSVSSIHWTHCTLCILHPLGHTVRTLCILHPLDTLYTLYPPSTGHTVHSVYSIHWTHCTLCILHPLDTLYTLYTPSTNCRLSIMGSSLLQVMCGVLVLCYMKYGVLGQSLLRIKKMARFLTCAKL